MVLAVAETRDGRAGSAAREALAAAQAMGDTVCAVVLTAPGASPAAQLADADVREVISLEHDLLDHYTADAHTSALAALVRETAARAVVFAHTYQTRDYAPRLAMRLGAAFIPDCTRVSGEPGAWRFARPMFGGKLMAEVAADQAAVCLATFQRGIFSADDVRRAPAPVPVRVVAADIDPAVVRQRPDPPFQEVRATVDLGRAERIVAVGRGIKAREQLPVAQALAAALGAELAASRPICDAGWLPMDRQVGSSGQTVRPALYVALGISGAIQHIVGMRGARTIVAINSDPEAPIFEIADYGIVGDLFEIVPALVAALRT
jgi:electron transfer flavoprotein alpha subunit